MSVKVAVRVRPFNTREKDNKSTCNIEMNGNQTIIKDELGQPRTFTFDHSFWSHDCYIEKENGYLSPDSSGKYADQNLVFDTLGKQIFDLHIFLIYLVLNSHFPFLDNIHETKMNEQM